MSLEKNADAPPRRIIPKNELKHGAYYYGSHRRANIARWNAEDQYFYYLREKCNEVRVEACRHREDENYVAVFDAFEEIPIPDTEIPFEYGKLVASTKD